MINPYFKIKEIYLFIQTKNMINESNSTSLSNSFTQI